MERQARGLHHTGWSTGETPGAEAGGTPAVRSYLVFVKPRGVAFTSALLRSMPWRLSSMVWRM